MAHNNIDNLPPLDGHSKLVNVVIETSKGSRAKLKYDAERGVFRSEKMLPVGLVFPFDFGFVPSTEGGDGDPLDVLLIGEEPLPWGTVVLGEVIGVIKAQQTQDGHTNRNDRLIAIPIDAKTKEPMQPAVAFDAKLKDAISDFFVKYNELQGKKFKVLGFEGPKGALAILQQGMKQPGIESGQEPRSRH